jgi:hypothetical protein
VADVLEQEPVESQDAQQPPEEEPQEETYEWNEDLPLILQSALKDRARKFCEEDRYSRRLEVQECRRARFFWRGLQHLTWDWKAEGWNVVGGTPNAGLSAARGSKDSAVLYVTNIYQAFGLGIQAVLNQSLPSVRFEPQDSNDPADIDTAKAANRMRSIIEHENDGVKMMTEMAYYSWTDGRVAAWTRMETDKRTGKLRETISMYGAMEVKVPITSSCVDDMPYLQFSDEYHESMVKSEVKAMNWPDPDYFKKIKGGAQGNGQDTYERTARISVKQGVSLLSQSGDTLSHLVTKQQTWMRKESYVAIDDKAQREEIETKFPDGCWLVLANGEYIGAKNACLDDCWSILLALPGDGQFRNALGSSFLPVQERFNDVINIAQDVFEKGIPASWASSTAVDSDGVFRQTSKPAARYPIVKDPGEAIADNFFFEPPAQFHPQMLEYANELSGELGQMLTGYFAALAGGDTKGNDTASGISIQRNQALGRIGPIWHRIKCFWAQIMEQAVRLSAQRDEDASITVPSDDGDTEKTSVRIEELQGKVFCFPDTDEAYPVSYSDQKSTMMQLVTASEQNPGIAAILQEPQNLRLIKRLIGLEELEIPGDESGTKQLNEINLLLKAVPIPIPPPPPQVGPMGVPIPVPPQPPQLGPSIPVDPIFDRHPIEFEAGMEWINSPTGQKATVSNPNGFANVRLHLLQHKQAMTPPPPPPQGIPPAAALDAIAAAHAHGAAHGTVHGALAAAHANAVPGVG